MNSFNCFICNSLASWKCNCLTPCTYGCWKHICDHLGSSNLNHPIIPFQTVLQPTNIEKIKNLYQIYVEEINLQANNFDKKVDNILRDINEKREKIMLIRKAIIYEKSLILEKLKNSPQDFWNYEVIETINNDNIQDRLAEIMFFDYEKLENAIKKFDKVYNFEGNKKLKQINAELISCKKELKLQRINSEAKEKEFNDLNEENKALKVMIDKLDLEIKEHGNQLKSKDQYYEGIIKEKEENFKVEYKNLHNEYENLIPKANMDKIIEKENKIKELEGAIKEKEKLIEELKRKIQRSSMQIKTEEETRGDNKAIELINKSFQKNGEESKKAYGSDNFQREKKIKTHGERGYEPTPQKKPKYDN